MSLPMSIELSTLSKDHQEVALFQTRLQFWAYFIGAWVMSVLGLIPIVFLWLMPLQPLTLKITAIALGFSFEMFSLCFARGLKQTRKWLDNHYDRLRSDERIMQARQLVDSIENDQLRDTMKAEMAKRLFSEDSQVVEEKDSLRNVLTFLFPAKGA